MTATAQGLIELARERADLADFGADGWQEGLDHLLAAVSNDVGDNAAAVRSIEEIVIGRLVNRLRIEQWHREHPDAAGPPVEGPVVILGLPRTATTALHYLLAVDPRFRYPRTWELADPVPPPVAETESEDPRLLAANGRANVRHIKTVGGPVEDVITLGLDFHNQELALPLPAYTKWWREADLTTTFAYHERVLRMLHSSRPPYRWLLKAPAYLFQVARIAAQYPNARFLMTHRDPAMALPSACSTVASSRRDMVPAAEADPGTLGRELLEHFSEGTMRTIHDRHAVGEERFLDIGQREIETDPLATVERIYDFLGIPLTTGIRSDMAGWAAENQRGARGTHVYSAEDFGMDTTQIRHAFAGYLDRFRPFTDID